MSHEKHQNKKRDREVEDAVSYEAILGRFEALLSEINYFNQDYLKLCFDLRAQEEAARQQKIEVSQKIFTLAPVFHDLYIDKIRMFYDHSLTLHDCYQLKREIAQLDFVPDNVIALRDELDEHIRVIDLDVRDLLNFYVQHKDVAFKKDIQSKLDEKPALKEWVKPFFHPEDGIDSLQQAVEGCVEEALKRRKVERIETIKAVFELEVEAKLSEFQTQVDAHLDCLDEFDGRFEAASPQQTYHEKVELYAEYCSTVLKHILQTNYLLSVCINAADKCIREINDPSEAGDMVKVLLMLTRLKDTLSNEINGIYRPMKALAENYSTNEGYLSPRLKVFMQPWLNPAHPSPLPASINAYENAAYSVPPVPSISVNEPGATAPSAPTMSQLRRM